MALGIPPGKMVDEIRATGGGVILGRIGFCKGSEELAPRGGSIEVIGIIEGVARFMSEKHHDHFLPYVDSCSLTNERDEGGASKIEGDADDRDLIRAPPVI